MRRELYTLDFALSGKAALDILDGRIGEQVILLVSDINMPGMTGLELVPVVKQRRPDLPDKFLTKPVDFPQLKRDITAVMADATERNG